MADAKIKRENFVTLLGWMLTDLKLKGNELIVFACIYGFSQAENQAFSGSLQYLCDWTNSTKQGVMKCLKSLCAKGYITKSEKHINGVKFCEYRATKLYSMQQSLIGGMQQSLPNNIELDNIETTTTTKGEPLLCEVYAYFKEALVMDAVGEARRFHAYNSSKGWNTKDWKATADLWIARIKK